MARRWILAHFDLLYLRFVERRVLSGRDGGIHHRIKPGAKFLDPFRLLGVCSLQLLAFRRCRFFRLGSLLLGILRCLVQHGLDHKEEPAFGSRLQRLI
jgi:hypothetical protein